MSGNFCYITLLAYVFYVMSQENQNQVPTRPLFGLAGLQ